MRFEKVKYIVVLVYIYKIQKFIFDSSFQFSVYKYLYSSFDILTHVHEQNQKYK